MNLKVENQKILANRNNISCCPNTPSKNENILLARWKNRSRAWIIGLLLILVGVGCSSSPSPKTVDTAKNSGTTVVQSSPPGQSFNKKTQVYKLRVEDEIEVKFHLVPELNDRVKVRPDGKISLQIIDEVEVLGMTPSELDKVLTKKYSKTLRNPDLTVIVRKFSGQKVFVGGEVNTQGVIPIHGRLTVTQAIMQAGGFKDTAKIENVVLMRNQGEKDPYFAILNLDNNLHDPMGALASNGVLLQPYDVVFVPKSTIATLDQFVDQYINKLVPQSFQWGFQWFTNLGGTGIVP